MIAVFALTQLVSPATLNITLVSVAEGIFPPLFHVHHIQTHEILFSFLAKGQIHTVTSSVFQVESILWTRSQLDFGVLQWQLFLSNLFSSETSLGLQFKSGGILFFDPTLSGLRSKLISLQMASTTGSCYWCEGNLGHEWKWLLAECPQHLWAHKILVVSYCQGCRLLSLTSSGIECLAQWKTKTFSSLNWSLGFHIYLQNRGTYPEKKRGFLLTQRFR